MHPAIIKHVQKTTQSLERTKRKLANFMVYGVVKLVNYAGGMLKVQTTGMDGEVNSNMAHPQEYGFASCPQPGAYSVSTFKGGSRDNGIVTLINDPRYAPSDLSSGDSCQYDVAGNRIWLQGENGILIKNGNNTVAMNDQGVTITDGSGNQIMMTAAGIKVSTPDAQPVIFDAPVIFNQGWTLNGGTGLGTGAADINIDGNVSAAGSVSDGHSSMEEMRIIYDSHDHDAPGGLTGEPNQPMT